MLYFCCIVPGVRVLGSNFAGGTISSTSASKCFLFQFCSSSGGGGSVLSCFCSASDPLLAGVSVFACISVPLLPGVSVPAVATVLAEHIAGAICRGVCRGKCACFCHVCHGLVSFLGNGVGGRGNHVPELMVMVAP